MDNIWGLGWDVVVFKADYDNTALSDAYGVTKQHTFVSLDANWGVAQKKAWVVTINQINGLF